MPELHDVRLLVEHRCEECEGSGVVYDPTGFGWRELVKLDDKAFMEAVGERGLSPKDALPPEEGDCPDCDGSGRSTAYVTPLELWKLVWAAHMDDQAERTRDAMLSPSVPGGEPE